MESVELVAKNSNREKEKTLTGGEDFSVDDLLDLPNDDVFSENDDEVLQRKKGLSLSLNDENTLHRSNDDISTADGSLPTSELAVPMHDEQELEWLSNFVEETNKYFDPYAPTAKPVWLAGNRKHPVPPVNKDSCLKPPLPRNKRARTVLTDSSSSSTTSSSSSSGRSRSSTLCLSGAEFLHEPMVQRQEKKKKKRQTQSLMLMQAQTQTRKCSHCGVQRTPQWRTGPMGAKTLCNACGVRFKSGRLFPEYRPACSPTFSSELHSNHHRRVVEMRLKKEMADDADGTGF